jgi:small subunit ribosomal protein S7
MSRRARANKRIPRADSRYNSRTIGRFINKVMQRGKKTVSEGLVYGAFEIIQEKTKKSPTEVFEQALKNAGPMVEVKPRRVGGATLQVPMEVPSDRRQALAMRWIIAAAKARPGKSFADRLAAELMDAAAGQGATIKKKEEVLKQAEANRAFAHYRF